MEMEDIFNVSMSIIGSLGGGGVLVVCLSSYLGKLWAGKMMEDEKAEHGQKLEELRAANSRVLEAKKADFSKELEDHKKELSAQIKELEHKNQLNQLRTSLFFDHQREAFAEIISVVSESMRIWQEAGSCRFELHWAMQLKEFDAIQNTYTKHKLFLDEECVAAIDIIINQISDTMFAESEREDDEPLDSNMLETCYSKAFYILSRLSKLFQEKIGIDVNGEAKREIALLGAMICISRYRDYTPDSSFKLEHNGGATQMVHIAKEHEDEVTEELKQMLNTILRRDMFSYDAVKVKMYLKMLGAE